MNLVCSICSYNALTTTQDYFATPYQINPTQNYHLLIMFPLYSEDRKN